MSSPINKKTLEHLAELARIELSAHEEEKFLKELESVLGYFEELRAVDTSAVQPLAGRISEINVLREDTERENTNLGRGKNDFPSDTEGFLKVPPVF
jgi:aspartyl-tRNA(Asn)/glutamyl-tRNA(Gln) amidotransferase subunit C